MRRPSTDWGALGDGAVPGGIAGDDSNRDVALGKRNAKLEPAAADCARDNRRPVHSDDDMARGRIEPCDEVTEGGLPRPRRDDHRSLEGLDSLRRREVDHHSCIMTSAAASATVAAASTRSAPSSASMRSAAVSCCEEPSRRLAERKGEGCAENRGPVKLLGGGKEAGEEGEGAPGEREPGVAVEASAEELEVVGDDDERAGGDERSDPGVDEDGADHADRNRGRDRDDRERDENALG